MLRKRYYGLYVLLALGCFASLLALTPTVMRAASARSVIPAANIGSVVRASMGGYYVQRASEDISYVHADWNISCNSSSSGRTHAIWIGIGGMVAGHPGIKLGTTADSVSNGGNGSLFFQDTNRNLHWIGNNQNCRDHISATLYYNSATGTFRYNIVNNSAKCGCINESGDAGIPDRSTAEWMDSRAYCNGQISPLDNFHYSAFSNSQLNFGQGNENLGSVQYHQVNMYSGSTLLASPGSVSGGSFQNYWHNAGYGTSCGPHADEFV